ncbi:hypothetical protein QUH32_28710, partial [Klebsiella pneumoniae]
QVIKPVQKKQGLILDEFSHVNGSLCCLFMKAPARKCLLYVRMLFRFLAHSLTPFGHESAASGGRISR